MGSFLFSFALTQKKQKVKAAYSPLLHERSPLKKKNSLRSNNFFFFTLHPFIPFYAANMRPVLLVSERAEVGERIAFASLGCHFVTVFILRYILGYAIALIAFASLGCHFVAVYSAVYTILSASPLFS